MPETITRLLPDLRACAVARAVEDAVHPDTVTLFGSRARGDFTPDSDIDLLIITGSRHANQQDYQRTSAAAHRKAREVYGHAMGVDLLHLSEGDFHFCRRARNHVAGQAARDGVDIYGDTVTYDNFENDPVWANRSLQMLGFQYWSPPHAFTSTDFSLK